MIKKAKIGANKILLRPGTRVGFSDAEDDAEFLKNCYIDTGQLDNVLNTEDPGSILLGRTGCGKTAAILRIKETQEHCIQIEPEDLSLNFISNSNIISFFHGMGVDLDLFFQLLWRHILCVELLNYHYNVRNQSEFEHAFGILKDLVGKNKSKKQALEYLSTWGTKFWDQTQERIKEIVKKFETELSAGIDLNSFGVPLNARGSDKLSQETRAELEHHAKTVVNNIQIKKLSNLMDILADDIFDDRKVKYFILVDRLDEKWVDDNLKLRLIRSLIETIKAFRKIRSVKLVISIRKDLLEQVYKYTRSSGFQEEKYEDLNIKIQWSEKQLFDLVDRRISDVFKRKYTRDNVGFYDLFPQKYRQNDSMFQHLLARTLMRPRDIIAFVNEIFSLSDGSKGITADIVDRSESEYSKKRVQAICTEWQDEHPFLETYIETLRGMPTRIKVQELSESVLERTLLSIFEKSTAPDGFSKTALSYVDGKASPNTSPK